MGDLVLAVVFVLVAIVLSAVAICAVLLFVKRALEMVIAWIARAARRPQ